MIRKAADDAPSDSLRDPSSADAAPTDADGETRPSLLAKELAELGRIARLYGELEFSRLRIGVERAGLSLARKASLLLAGLACAASMLVLCVVGLVGGLATLTGVPWWAAALMVGIGIPSASALWFTLVLRRYDLKRAAALREQQQALDPAS